MEILLQKEDLVFKDIIDYCYNKLKTEKVINGDVSNLQIDQTFSVKKTSKNGGNNMKNCYKDFSSKVIDVWSCVFWRAQKELEKNIELVLADLLRIWKTEDNDIILSIIPKNGFESFTLIRNTLTSKFNISGVNKRIHYQACPDKENKFKSF
jgi:hypothetical protein